MRLGCSYGAKNRQPLDIPHYVLEAPGKRKEPGRPRKRWRDDLDSFLKHLHRVAQNVVQRRSMGKD